MALTINTYHGTQNRTKRSGGLGSIANFVTHYTGGTGSAKNNCIYFSGGYRGASADLFIDKDGTIWEYNNVLDGYYTWAVGDGKGKYGITNTNSMSVEVVSNGEDFTAAQIQALHDLYAHYCSVLGRKLTVVRHYDASRKSCPAAYVDASKWAVLKAQIEGGTTVAPSPSPSPSKPTASAPKPATGKVADFQTWMNSTYGFKLGVDNKFGPATKSHAVKALQTEYNKQFGEKLSVDGLVGPKTQAAWSRHNIKRGAKGNITRAIQGLLYSRGYDPNGFDGSFGPGCEAAVKSFQRKSGIGVDGIVGKGTLTKLTA